MHRVMIHPATYANCRNAVDQAFTLFPMDMRNKKVLIKPNVLRASNADEHIVTHPALLKAVVEKIEGLSPSQIMVGDNPGIFSYGDNEKSFIETGLMQACKGYYRNLGNHPRHLAFNPEYMAEVAVSEEILDADIVISLPKFKTHGLTVMTGAIKTVTASCPEPRRPDCTRSPGLRSGFMR